MNKRRTILNEDARLRDQRALAKIDSAASLEHTPGKKLKSTPGSSKHGSSKPGSTKKKRFRIPESDVVPGEYTPAKKNPIHSILTALPVLMLIAGLYYFYSGESEQANGVPIFAESETVTGDFTGLSELKSGSDGQHFFWLTEDTRKRGIRIQASEVSLFAGMERGLPAVVEIAPTVSGSTTYWAWRVTIAGELVLERETSRDGL